MNLEQLIKPDSVLCNANARSKKHCLEILSELLAQNNPDTANEEIFSKLIERERLGCTSLGQGVAFPRCRIEAINNCSGALIKLSQFVDFDAADGELVDLVFGLIVPSNVDASHHADLELISTRLADPALRARLRAASTSSELYDAVLAGQSQAPAKIAQSQN